MLKYHHEHLEKSIPDAVSASMNSNLPSEDSSEVQLHATSLDDQVQSLLGLAANHLIASASSRPASAPSTLNVLPSSVSLIGMGITGQGYGYNDDNDDDVEDDGAFAAALAKAQRTSPALEGG